MHKVVDGEVFFWLTLRAVDETDPFNGMWHYIRGPWIGAATTWLRAYAGSSSASSGVASYRPAVTWHLSIRFAADA